jgi:hypothetical protein
MIPAREMINKRFLMIRLVEQYLDLLNAFEPCYQLTSFDGS